LMLSQDTISTHPLSFGIPPKTCLTNLCQSSVACDIVFDLMQAGEGQVQYGDGVLYCRVVFCLVIFRPFTLMTDVIESLDADSILCTFPDRPHLPTLSNWFHFIVPESELTTSSELLDMDIMSRMYIDTEEVVYMRVEVDEFLDDEEYR
ncbi:uncharacterized protein EV420DRAFT_1261324, partial [Desarmillaria tabescens]